MSDKSLPPLKAAHQHHPQITRRGEECHARENEQRRRRHAVDSAAGAVEHSEADRQAEIADTKSEGHGRRVHPEKVLFAATQREHPGADHINGERSTNHIGGLRSDCGNHCARYSQSQHRIDENLSALTVQPGALDRKDRGEAGNDRQRSSGYVHSEQKLHAACLRAGAATLLTISQKASVISNTATGSQTSGMSELGANPASCSGRMTTGSAEPNTPSQARATGIIRPRSRRYENSVLPTAKSTAAVVVSQVPTFNRYPARAFADSTSGAAGPVLVASQSSPSEVNGTAATRPSPTRQANASIASS